MVDSEVLQIVLLARQVVMGMLVVLVRRMESRFKVVQLVVAHQAVAVVLVDLVAPRHLEQVSHHRLLAQQLFTVLVDVPCQQIAQHQRQLLILDMGLLHQMQPAAVV